MITVNLSNGLTDDFEAYRALIDTLVGLQNSDTLYPDDYICYNIGSPTL